MSFPPSRTALTTLLVICEQIIDRLLLGFKGTMSEAELHWLRQRLAGGKLEKAKRGQLRQHPPIGYVYDPVGALVFDPDEAIQYAVRLLFDLFEQLGSGLGVAKAFAQQGLPFPTRPWGAAYQHEIRWGPLTSSRVLAILHNPTYAGTYVHGKTRRQPTPTQPGRTTTRRLPPGEWAVMIPDAHPAYISPAQYQRHQQQLAANQRQPDGPQPGPAREGSGLLQLTFADKSGKLRGVKNEPSLDDVG
jgi:hypothetical protein